MGRLPRLRFLFSIAQVAVLSLTAPRPARADAQHVSAEGLFLRTTAGGLLVRAEGLDVTGSLAVPAGQQSDLINLTFLDPNGIEFTPADPAQFNWTVAAPTTASLVQTGPWQFRLQGLSAGTTTLEIRIWFINHVDYTSPLIPLRTVATTEVAPSDPASAGAAPVTLAIGPNPVVNQASLFLRLPAASRGRLAIVDASGRLLWSQDDLVLSSGENRVALPTEQLGAGIYWLRASGTVQGVGGTSWNATRSFLRLQ